MNQKIKDILDKAHEIYVSKVNKLLETNIIGKDKANKLDQICREVSGFIFSNINSNISYLDIKRNMITIMVNDIEYKQIYRG